MQKNKGATDTREKSVKKSWLAARYIGAVFLALMLMMSLPHMALAVGKGAKGPDVYVIQGMLKSLGSYAGPIDGSYGPKTIRGVKYYQ